MSVRDPKVVHGYHFKLVSERLNFQILVSLYGFGKGWSITIIYKGNWANDLLHISNLNFLMHSPLLCVGRDSVFLTAKIVN